MLDLKLPGLQRWDGMKMEPKGLCMLSKTSTSTQSPGKFLALPCGTATLVASSQLQSPCRQHPSLHFCLLGQDSLRPRSVALVRDAVVQSWLERT